MDPRVSPIRLPPLELEGYTFKKDAPQYGAQAQQQLQPYVTPPEAMAVMNWGGGNSSLMEERVAMMEQRLMAAERVSSKANDAFSMQSEMVAVLSNELKQVSSQLNNVRYAQATAAGTGASNQQQQYIEQQLQVLRGDMHNQGGMLMHTQQQLSEALNNNADLRSQMALMSDEIGRAAAHRASADAALDALRFQLQQGTQSLLADQQSRVGAAEHRQAIELSEQRRQLDMQDHAFREEARHRQAHHLAEVAALNREVEQFRAEARAATVALQSALEHTSSRLRAKEAQLDLMQVESVHQADKEAMALGGVRVQVAELQSTLASIAHEVKVEQAKHHSETRAHEIVLKDMEARMLEAQDGIIKRTVTMMENKAAAFERAVQEMGRRAEERNAEVKTNTDQAFQAIVRASNTREKAGMQRVGAIESALMDIAGATAMAMHQLQTKIDTGVSQLEAMVDFAQSSTEGREIEMREQVNVALTRIKTYTQDMEGSLEQERLQLEEVVKLEIKGRMKAIEKLRAEQKAASAELEGKIKGTSARFEPIENALQRHSQLISKGNEVAGILRRDVDELTAAAVNAKMQLGKLHEALEAQQAWAVTSFNEVNAKQAAESIARSQGMEQLQQQQEQNQAEAAQQLDACTQQISAVEQASLEAQSQASARMDEAEARAEAKDKAAEEEAAAAKADLDQQLESLRTGGAAQLQAATEELTKAIAADKQEIYAVVEGLKEELVDAVEGSSERNELYTQQAKEELLDFIGGSQDDIQAVSAAMKEELLSKVDELKSSQEAMQSDMTAKLEEEVLAQVADLKTSQDAMQSDLSAKIEEEEQRLNELVSSKEQQQQTLEEHKVALGVALAAVGVTFEESLQASSQETAATLHSQAVQNNATTAVIVERVAELEARQAGVQDSLTGLTSAMPEQQEALQRQVQELQTTQQELQMSQQEMAASQQELQAAQQQQQQLLQQEMEAQHSQQLAGLTQQLAEVQTQLQEAQAQLQGSQAQLDQQLQEVQGQLGQQVDGAMVAGLEKQVSALEGKLQEMEALQMEGTGQKSSLGEQLQQLELSHGLQSQELEVAMSTLKGIEGQQQQTLQATAAEIEAVKQELLEAQMKAAAALLVMKMDPQSITAESGRAGLEAAAALARREWEDQLMNHADRLARLEASGVTSEDRVASGAPAPAADGAQVLELQASLRKADARIQQLEHWKDSLATTNALFSDVKDLENQLIGRIEQQAQANEQLQAAVQELAEMSAQGGGGESIDTEAAKKMFLTPAQANKKFASAAIMQSLVDEVKSLADKTNESDRVIIEAMKGVDERFATQSEGMASVLIRTAQQVDFLHNSVNKLKEEHDRVMELTGQESPHEDDEEPAVMAPMGSFSGMKALVARQNAPADRSVYELGERLSNPDPEIERRLSSLRLSDDSHQDYPQEEDEPSPPQHRRLTTILEGNPEDEVASRTNSMVAQQQQPQQELQQPQPPEPQEDSRLPTVFTGDSAAHPADVYANAPGTTEDFPAQPDQHVRNPLVIASEGYATRHRSSNRSPRSSDESGHSALSQPRGYAKVPRPGPVKNGKFEKL